MNYRKISFFLSTFLVISFSFAQKQDNSSDTSNMDSFFKELVKKAQNWKQENEPWIKLVITLPEPKIEIIYYQQTAHPFLAEYNRKIIFKSEKEQSDTIDMFENTGGRTMFNLYFQKSRNKRIIVMEDNFGFYYYDIDSKVYSEDISKNKMRIMMNSTTRYLGRIDGEFYPLKFIDINTKPKKEIKRSM